MPAFGFFDGFRAVVGKLFNDGCRQQFLFGAEAQQILAADDVDERTAGTGRHPADALCITRAARLQR